MISRFSGASVTLFWAIARYVIQAAIARKNAVRRSLAFIRVTSTGHFAAYGVKVNSFLRFKIWVNIFDREKTGNVISKRIIIMELNKLECRAAHRIFVGIVVEHVYCYK